LRYFPLNAPLEIGVMKLETLRKRREFLRVRGGGRWSTHAFVLEAKRRLPIDEGDKAPLPHTKNSHDGPRFGFTVTKRLGNAVARNRIRRRLKAALQEVAMPAAKNHFDYVLIARAAAFDMTFADLTGLMAKAFERVHQPASGRRQRHNKSKSDESPGKSGKQTADTVQINPKT
jgi:ribonuclease P protein component